MAVFTSTDAKVLMPRTILAGMVKDVRTTSTVARLSAREPMLFGESDIIVFNDFPKMEFVGEGADKGSSDGGFTSVTAKPYKGQVTLRFNEEVQWADEDYQLGVLSELAAAGQLAISRGLDLGLFHRINPLSGTATSWTNYLNATTRRYPIGALEADAAVRAAVGLLVQRSKPVNGFAIDPRLAWDLANLQTKLANGDPSGTPRYPSLGFGTDVQDFLGIPVAQGDTVSGTPEALDTKVRGIVGDFQNGIRWGIQRQLPVEIIRFGDPDGQGDLKRKNQIALRLEVVYGWYVFTDRFAVIDAKTVSSVALTPTAVGVGADVQLVATATFNDGSTANVTGAAYEWTSTDATKVTVNSDGVMHGVATGGTPKISAKFAGTTSAQASITVS